MNFPSKSIFTLLLLAVFAFCLNSCGQKPSKATQAMMTAKSKILELYGGIVTVQAIVQKWENEGDYEIKLSGSEMLNSKQMHPLAAGSNSAVILYKSLIDSDLSVKVIYVEAEVIQNGEPKLNKYTYDPIQLSDALKAYEKARIFADLIIKKDAGKAYDLLQPNVTKELTVQVMDSLFNKLEKEFGKPEKYEPMGFAKEDLSKRGITAPVFQVRGSFFIGEKKNRLVLYIDPANADKFIYGFSF